MEVSTEMETATRVKVRRANKAAGEIGQHWTIAKILDTGSGFAVADDGENAFIPKPVISKWGITEESEGAGFTAPTRPPSANAGADALPQIMEPVVWDEDDGEVAELQRRVDELTDMIPVAKKLVQRFEERHNMLHQMIRENQNDKEIAQLLLNELVAKRKWMDEEYPNE